MLITLTIVFSVILAIAYAYNLGYGDGVDDARGVKPRKRIGRPKNKQNK